MRVRDGVASDAPALASFDEFPVAVAERLLRDRTVRIAVSQPDGNRDGPASEPDIIGYIAFSARPGTVHITRLGGDDAVLERLLNEPLRFARAESMAVEVVLPRDEPAVSVIRSVGFESVGDGPTFRGDQTRRYRYTPPS